MSCGTDAATAFAGITRRPYVEPPQLPRLALCLPPCADRRREDFMAAHTVAIAADAFLMSKIPWSFGWFRLKRSATRHSETLDRSRAPKLRRTERPVRRNFG